MSNSARAEGTAGAGKALDNNVVYEAIIYYKLISSEYSGSCLYRTSLIKCSEPCVPSHIKNFSMASLVHTSAISKPALACSSDSCFFTKRSMFSFMGAGWFGRICALSLSMSSSKRLMYLVRLMSARSDVFLHLNPLFHILWCSFLHWFAIDRPKHLLKPGQAQQRPSLPVVHDLLGCR